MKQRYLYLDVLRILAIFLVLMNHEPAYKLFMSESGACEAFAILEAIIIKINVPLFAMISGALLLRREETISQLWHKRISRILWVILIFSALLYVELGWLRDRSINFHDFIYGLMAGNLKSLTSYWFLYAYLGFLLMLPFLRKVAQSMTKAEFFWLMGIQVVFTTIFPLISLILRLSGNEPLVISNNICVPLSGIALMFYPLIGYFIDRHVDIEPITKKQWTYMGSIFVLFSFITILAVYIEGKTFKFTQTYLGLFTYLNAIIAFLLIKKIFNRRFADGHLKLSNIITTIAPLTFGIYLLDMAVQLPIWRDMKSTMVPFAGDFWFSILWCLTSFVLGGTITYLLKRLPFFRTLL